MATAAVALGTDGTNAVKESADLCKTCNGTIRLRQQKRVECDFCGNSFHGNVDCAGIQPKFMDVFQNNHILYKCQECIIKNRKGTNELEEFKDTMRQLMKDVVSSFKTLEQNTKDRINQIEHTFNKTLRDGVGHIMNRMDENIDEQDKKPMQVS